MSNKVILVTGHKSPDTDSFCAAISYAYYKTQKGQVAKPICAGEPNKETKYALNYFNVEQPPVVADFYVKVNEVMTVLAPVTIDANLEALKNWIEENGKYNIPVVDGKALVGMIEVATIENANINATAKDIMVEPVVVEASYPVHDLNLEETGALAVVEGEEYVGMVMPGFAMPEKQKVILVDHNEKVQIIDGIEEAEIFENIDHHRIGGLVTEKPIFIHYEPVGCTCTIIANFYRNEGMEIPKHIAGLMLSAIISDTVLFRSPTCTEKDVETAKFLAEVAGVDLEAYGMEMLKAGADVSDLTNEEIVRTDMKEFNANGKVITIAQISLMDTTDILKEQDALIEALEGLRKEGNYSASYLMITNILKESTNLLYSGDAEAVVTAAFNQSPVNNGVYLEKTMSRKKQIVPPVLGAMN